MHFRDVVERISLPGVMFALLLMGPPVHAQQPDEPPAETTAEPGEESPGVDVEPNAEPSPETSTGAATAGPSAPSVNAEAEPGAEAKPIAVAAPVTEERKPPPLALEHLPATAYPSHPIPGIPWGSLALSINHLQWPYMPKYPGEPDFRIGFSGGSWVDTSIRSVRAGLENEANQLEYRMQGRLTLRASGVYNRPGDWFVQSNTEFVANTDQNNNITNYVDIDEAWIRAGKWKLFDITVGRLQGFEVYHFGMGLDLNTFERLGAASFSKTPTQPYALDTLWDRGINNGAAALHWYYPEWLRLEFLTRIGVSGEGKQIGIRPVFVIDLGWVKLKGGYERNLSNSLFRGNNARIETQGVGGSLQFIYTPWVELGGNVAHRVNDAFDQYGAVRPAGSDTITTWGGFANARPYLENWLVGIGYNRTSYRNFNIDAFDNPERTTHQQMFGAVQYVLWERLYIKYVLAYSRAHIKERDDTDPTDTGFVNESLGHRLRLMLLY
jgi:hypothetical protein